MRPDLRHLHLAYAGALSLVALVSLGAWFVLEGTLTMQGENAELINVAGRQRMLSQRISLLSRTPGGEPRLVAAVETMRAANHRLLDEPLSDGVANLVQPENLEFMRSLRGEVRAFLDLASTRAPGLEMRSEVLLPQLDAFVKILEQGADRKLAGLARMEHGLLALTFCLLLAEALLLFRPLVRRLGVTMAAVTRERNHAQSRERLLSQVLDQMSDAVALLDRDGHVRRFASKRFYETFGSSGEPSLSARLGLIHSIEWAVGEGPTEVSYEGRSYVLELQPFEVETDASGFLAILRDTTDEEEQARARQREVARIRTHLVDDDLIVEALEELRALFDGLPTDDPSQAIVVLQEIRNTAIGYSFMEIAHVVEGVLMELEEDASALELRREELTALREDYALLLV